MTQAPNLHTAVDRCRLNGTRLLEDAQILHDYGRHPTGLALAVLAQEEFAKSFLLQLVSEGVLPWVPAVRRALSNHECKHLVSIIMEWLHRTSEEHLERVVSRVPDAPLEGVPDEVVFAMNILRHEKIERLAQGYAFREPEWGGVARRLADGLRERSKQRALYISVGKTGWPDGLPTRVPPELPAEEIARAERLRELATDAQRVTVLAFREYRLLREILAAVFENLSSTETTTEAGSA